MAKQRAQPNPQLPRLWRYLRFGCTWFGRYMMSRNQAQAGPSSALDFNDLLAEAVSYRKEEQADYLLAKRLEQLCPDV